MTEEQIDQLVNFMDLDSEGMVEYEEFLDSFIPVDSYYCSGPSGLPSPPDTSANSASGIAPNGGSSAKSATQSKNSQTNQKAPAATAGTAQGSKQPMEVDDGSRRFTFSSHLGSGR